MDEFSKVCVITDFLYFKHRDKHVFNAVRTIKIDDSMTKSQT